jgi:hypothetical protein
MGERPRQQQLGQTPLQGPSMVAVATMATIGGSWSEGWGLDTLYSH